MDDDDLYNPPASPLERLPDDLLCALLVRLSAAEVATAALASKRLRAAANDNERVWRPLCLRAFAPAAAASRGRALEAWRRFGPGWGTTTAAATAATTTRRRRSGDDDHDRRKRPPRPPPPLLPWRDTFRLLLHHAPLVGLWSGAGAGPRGVLVAARWGDGCVKVDQLLGGVEAILAARLRRPYERCPRRRRRQERERRRQRGTSGGRAAAPAPRSGSSTASESLDGSLAYEGHEFWRGRRDDEDDDDDQSEDDDSDSSDSDDDSGDDDETEDDRSIPDDPGADALLDAVLFGGGLDAGGGGPAHSGGGELHGARSVPPLLARRLCRVGPAARPRPAPGGGGGAIWWDFELEGSGVAAPGRASPNGGGGNEGATAPATMLWFSRRGGGTGAGSSSSAAAGSSQERLRLTLREYHVPDAGGEGVEAGPSAAAVGAGARPGSSGGGGGGGGGNNTNSLAAAAAAAAGVWQPPEGSGGGGAAAATTSGSSPAPLPAAAAAQSPAAAPPPPPPAATTFGASFTQFMATNVLRRSSSASRARPFGTSPDAAGSHFPHPPQRPTAAAAAAPLTFHPQQPPPPSARLRAAHRFAAVGAPRPSRRCPLAGVYRAAYGPHGLEAQCVSYDFSGQRPRVLARKLLGDPNVPAGEATWWAAVHEPLPLGEGAVERRRVIRRGFAVAEGGAGAAGAAGAATTTTTSPAAAAAAATTTTATASTRRRVVVAAYRGQGRIADAGFANPRWLDGRLWLFQDGALAFVWLLDEDEAAALGAGGAPAAGEAAADDDDLGGPDGSWWLTEYARLGPAELGKGLDAALRGVGGGTGGGGAATSNGGGGGGNDGAWAFASPLRVRGGADG